MQIARRMALDGLPGMPPVWLVVPAARGNDVVAGEADPHRPLGMPPVLDGEIQTLWFFSGYTAHTPLALELEV